MAIDLISLIKRAMKRKRQRNFLRDESGVTAIEFGLLAVPFFALIGAILETALVFLSGQILYSGVQDTSRFLRTGQMQAASYDLEKFKTNLCTRLYGMFGDCSGLHVEVQALNSFNAVNVSVPVDASCDPTKKTCKDWERNEVYQTSTGNNIMVVQVYYRWPVIFNFGGLNMANMRGNVRILGAAAVFRNEPFS